ncbi:MAG TPA: hypothetical protein VD866_24260 [Urbifossiella sp.]|nr:hypothetical protein [Urbifossiella sp.]
MSGTSTRRSLAISFAITLAFAMTASAQELSVGPLIPADGPVAVVFRVTRSFEAGPSGPPIETKGFLCTYVRNAEYVLYDWQDAPPKQSRQYVVSRTGGDHYNASYTAGQSIRRADSLLIDAQTPARLEDSFETTDKKPALRFILVGRPVPVVYRGAIPTGGVVVTDPWGTYRLTTEPDPQTPGGTVVVVTLVKSGSDDLVPLRIQGKVFEGRMDAPNGYWVEEVFREPKLKLKVWREELRLRYQAGRTVPSEVAYTHTVESESGKKHRREYGCEIVEHATDPATVDALMEKTRIKIKSGAEVTVVTGEGEDEAVRKMWSNGKAVDKVNSKVFDVAGTRFTRTRLLILVALLVGVVGVVVFALRKRGAGKTAANEPPPQS